MSTLMQLSANWNPETCSSAVLQEDFRRMLKTIKDGGSDYFGWETKNWQSLLNVVPGFNEAALSRRLNEIDRDRELFGAGGVSFAIGETFDGLSVRFLTGNGYATVSFTRPIDPSLRDAADSFWTATLGILNDRLDAPTIRELRV